MTAISVGVSKSTVLMKSCASDADDHGRQEGEQDRQRRSGGPAGRSGSARGEREQPAGIDRQDRQDRAELDQHLEGLAGRVEAEEMPGEQDVAGGGDGDELGQPLEHAEEGGDQERLVLQGSGPQPGGGFLDRGVLAVRPVGVEVALEHRLHRRRRDAEVGEAAGRPGRRRCRGASSCTWSRVRTVLVKSPRLARCSRVEDAGLEPGEPEGHGHDQPAAADDRRACAASARGRSATSGPPSS